MRIHRQFIAGTSKIMPIAFRNHPPDSGMSTDWDRYSKAEQCRERARMPADNAVVKINVASVRRIPDQTVVHDPLPDNYAHTQIFGDKKSDPEVRARFLMISEVVIPVSAT